jgi:hypothetical protein
MGRRTPDETRVKRSYGILPFVVEEVEMDDKVALRLDRSPRMTARGILDHPGITEFA